jgi:hypothetical protein
MMPLGPLIGAVGKKPVGVTVQRQRQNTGYETRLILCV